MKPPKPGEAEPCPALPTYIQAPLCPPSLPTPPLMALASVSPGLGSRSSLGAGILPGAGTPPGGSGSRREGRAGGFRVPTLILRGGALGVNVSLFLALPMPGGEGTSEADEGRTLPTYRLPAMLTMSRPSLSPSQSVLSSAGAGPSLACQCHSWGGDFCGGL